MELDEVFYDDAREIAPKLIKELGEKRQALVKVIGDELAVIKAANRGEVYEHFWRLWLMLHQGEELQEVDRKLAYLHRVLNIVDGKPAPKGMLPDELIEAARAVPVTDIVGEPVKRSGKDQLCICPLHDDHDPSLRVYTEENKAWCHVCSQGGDTIDLYMLMNGCDFRTAVRELAGATV